MMMMIASCENGETDLSMVDSLLNSNPDFVVN